MKIRVLVAMLLLAFVSRGQAQSVNWAAESTASGMARLWICGDDTTRLAEVFANWAVTNWAVRRDLGTVEKIEKKDGLITVTITNRQKQSIVYAGLGAVSVVLHEGVKIGDKIGDLPSTKGRAYFLGIQYRSSDLFLDPRPFLQPIRPYCEK